MIFSVRNERDINEKDILIFDGNGGYNSSCGESAGTAETNNAVVNEAKMLLI